MAHLSSQATAQRYDALLLFAAPHVLHPQDMQLLMGYNGGILWVYHILFFGQKVPRRGSLALDVTSAPVSQPGTAGSRFRQWAHVLDFLDFLDGFPRFPGFYKFHWFPQKVYRTAVICTFCISAQNRPNAPFRSDMAATLAWLGANFDIAEILKMQISLVFSTWRRFVWSNVPLVSLLGPTWCEAVANGPQDAPLWTRLGLPCAWISAQIGY